MVPTVKCWMENADITDVFFFFLILKIYNIKNVWRNMLTQILIVIIKKKKKSNARDTTNFTTRYLQTNVALRCHCTIIVIKTQKLTCHSLI